MKEMMLENNNNINLEDNQAKPINNPEQNTLQIWGSRVQPDWTCNDTPPKIDNSFLEFSFVIFFFSFFFFLRKTD